MNIHTLALSLLLVSFTIAYYLDTKPPIVSFIIAIGFLIALSYFVAHCILESFSND